MSEETHQKIVDFLSKEFAKGENHVCTRVEIIAPRNGRGLSGTPIFTWTRKESPQFFENLASIEELANEIIRIAQETVSSAPPSVGGVRFVVRTTQYAGGTQHCQFKIDSDLDDHPGESADLPGASGLVGQLMRHLDAKDRMLLQIMSLNSHTNARLIEDLAMDNARLRRERGQIYNEVEEARNFSMERQLVVQSQAASEERKDIALKQLMNLFPLVTQKLIASKDGGGGSGGGSTSGGASTGQIDELTQAVNVLADTMTNEQFQDLLPKFDEKQRDTLTSIFVLARQRKAEAQAIAQAQAAGAPQPASPPPASPSR